MHGMLLGATLFAVVFTAVAQGPAAEPASDYQSPHTAGPVEGYLAGADGVRLFFRRVGSGEAVAIVLHGGPGINMHDGDCYFEPLARGRTVVLYDQRGGGRSELISDPKLLTASHHVRDLEALRQHLGAERIDLIGLSWGSGLAALYASEHPGRIRRMLLVAPMPVARTPYAAERRASLDAILGAQRARLTEISKAMPTASDVDTVALCRESYGIGARPYLKDPGNWLRETCDRCNASPASIRNRAVVARATLDSIGDWDFRGLLRRLPMPALVIEGAESNVPLDSTRAWAAEMPNARLLLIKNAGHLAAVEQPELFHRAIERFLAGEFPPDAEVVQKSTAK